MNGKSHYRIVFITFLALWVIFRIVFNKPYFSIIDVLIATICGIAPDVDQFFKKLGHRNWFLHSIIPFLVGYYFNQHFIYLMFILATGIHCICDIRFVKDVQRGFYCIKIINLPKRKYDITLNGRWSTVWLVSQFIIAVILFSYVMVIF